MVQQSDAVIIGTVTKDLGTKEVPGRIPDSPEKPQVVYIFKDYEVAVQRFIHPSSASTQSIAILAEAGVTSTDSSVKVVTFEAKLEFKVGERVLLFLESLQDPKFENPPGRPAPEGFTEQNYYRVILSARYGKLVPFGDKWQDSRTGIEVTVSEIEQAVARQNESQP